MSAPPSIDSERDGFCQVCGKPAHGIHFTIVSCRACAAFFRRSATDHDRFKCRRATEDCDVTRTNCRLCRWQRCKNLGMTTEDVVYTKRKRDPLEDELNDASCSRSIKELEEEELKLEGHKLNVDFSEDMPIIIDILSQPVKQLKRMKQTSLQVLMEAYKNMVPGGKPERIKITNLINMGDAQRVVRDQLKRIATWAMHCEEFAALPLEDKRKMFCGFGLHIQAIERCARAEEFMESECRPEFMLLEDDTAQDYLNYEIVLPGSDVERAKQLRDHFQTYARLALNSFVYPMKKLNLSTFEVVYLCFFQMWSSSKAPGVSPLTRRTAEKVLDSGSRELHDFYVRQLKMKNYAGRVSGIFDLITGLEETWRGRSATLLAADVGKLFYCNYDHSEFFDFTK